MNEHFLRHHIKILAICALAFLTFGPTLMQAATGPYTPLAPLPCIEGDGVKCGGTGTLVTQVNFQGYVQYAFNLLIAAAAATAVFMIVWGGFEYMTTAAVNDKKEGKKKIQNALTGLLLVLTSFLILKAINPQFVKISTELVPELELPRTGNIIGDLSTQLQESLQARRSENLQKLASTDQQIEAVSDRIESGEYQSVGQLNEDKLLLQDLKNKRLTEQVRDNEIVLASDISSILLKEDDSFAHSKELLDFRKNMQDRLGAVSGDLIETTTPPGLLDLARMNGASEEQLATLRENLKAQKGMMILAIAAAKRKAEVFPDQQEIDEALRQALEIQKNLKDPNLKIEYGNILKISQQIF